MVLHQSLRLDRVFHALAHPARRAMLRQLAHSERNLSALAAPLEMSFPAASKHVRVLERAELVRRRVEGRTHWCRVAGEPLVEASTWLEDYRRVWEANYARLDQLLGELTGTALPGVSPDAGAKRLARRGRQHKGRKRTRRKR